MGDKRPIEEILAELAAQVPKEEWPQGPLLLDEIQAKCDTLRAENAELWRTCPTIPMTPASEYRYDPVPLILAGEKTHTLRGLSRRVGSFADVTVDGKRTGIILRITGSERMEPEEYLTDEFAHADGIRGFGLFEGLLLRQLLEGFYPQWGGQLKARWRLDFQVYRRPEEEEA